MIIDVSGIGYRVYPLSDAAKNMEIGKEVSLHTHLSVRETALDIYGFFQYKELEFFEMLLSVSGIGPRSALAILSLAPTETLQQAIVEDDSSYLTKVSGIGRKNAQKIVLELKDKISALAEKSGVLLSGDVDTLEALKALGYSSKEARDGLKRIPPKITDPGDRLKEALKKLST